MSPAAQPNFGSILDKPAADINRPPPLPVGTYVGVIKGLPRFDKSSKKQTEFVEFTIQLTQAGEDVDKDELEAIGGLAEKVVTTTYYLTEKSTYRLKEFMIDDLGIEEQDTLRSMLDETPNRQVGVTIKHTPSDDGKGVYANVASTHAVE